MTTQPPSPEAVEAAIAYAAMNHRVDAMSEDVLRILWANVKPDCAGYSSAYALTAARILAAEVERLRAELDRRHKEYASALNRRVDVENTLAMVAAGKRDLLTKEECRELAVKLGVSPAAPCTKQP